MSKRPLLPHNGCGHGPITPPPGLEEARQKLKARGLKCGNCSQKFSAICALHKHLNGDSYHYDKELMTAYPLDENSCPSIDEGKISVTGTYMTENGPKMVTMTKPRKQCSRPDKIKKEPVYAPSRRDRLIKIQIYPEDNDDLEADPANVDLEYFGPPSVGKPESQTQSSQADFDRQLNAVVSQANEEFDDLAADGDEEFVENELPEHIKQELDNESLVSKEPKGQTDIENDGQEFVPKESAVPVGLPIPNVETMLSIPQNPVPDGEVTDGLQEPDDELYTQEQQDINELQPNVVQTPPLVMNKQMIIDLHSMETNADGSLKIVVGERDAAIFKTAQGEEILKALKAQGKGMSVKNTQIVYNYSVPVSIDGGTSDELAGTNINIPGVTGFSTTPMKRGMDLDEMSERKKKQKYMRQDDIGEEMAETVDGLEAVVFMNREEKITTAEAIAILGEVNMGMHEDKVSKIQPLKAKGGDLFVIDLEALPCKRDIRHDKYIWYNVGTRRYPKKKAVMKKSTFKIRLPDQTFSDGFMKSIFEWMDETERYCIIHYTGYEGIFKPFPHGNCKSGKNFVRTCRSVIEDLKEMAAHQDVVSPTEIFKQVKGSSRPDLRNLRAPRNLDQIKNHFFYEKKKKLAALRKSYEKEKGATSDLISAGLPAHTEKTELSPTNRIAVSLLNPSVQTITDSQLSQGTQPGVSLLAPMIQVSDSQSRDPQQPYAITVAVSQ